MRLDSAAPLSYAERKTGGFASPSRDGFAFIVDGTLLRQSGVVKVSLITDTFSPHAGARDVMTVAALCAI
jgi:hypothetical protein